MHQLLYFLSLSPSFFPFHSLNFSLSLCLSLLLSLDPSLSSHHSSCFSLPVYISLSLSLISLVTLLLLLPVFLSHRRVFSMMSHFHVDQLAHGVQLNFDVKHVRGDVALCLWGTQVWPQPTRTNKKPRAKLCDHGWQDHVKGSWVRGKGQDDGIRKEG